MDKRNLDFVYPNGSHKAVTLRFDDGPNSDKKMIGLLNQYHLKATFYLIGSKLMQGNGICENEVKKLYSGHEIGNHTFSHKDPRKNTFTSEYVQAELEQGKKFLESIIDSPVTGYAYVCSTYGTIGEDEYKRLLAQTGHKYAIMGNENKSFVPDTDDRFNIAQSFRFRDDMLIQKAEEFCAIDANELSIMLVMAHTYEFDDPKYGCNWQKVEAFCKTVSGKPDIWYATNGEVIQYLLAVSDFKNSNSMLNTTESTLYINLNGRDTTLKPNQNLADLI